MAAAFLNICLRTSIGLVLRAWATVLSADDPFRAPKIEDCGLITNLPALPQYGLRHLRLSKVAEDEKGLYDARIEILMPGRGELLLQRYFLETSVDGGGDIDREKQVDWDYVAGRKVAMGWLDGTTNLLLVS